MGANILIVEDEEPLTTLLRYNLEAEGYEVDAVARGDDADTRLKETAPDLIVLDWMLPGLSGVDIIEKIKTQNRNAAVLMVTAKTEAQDIVTGLEKGADDYMTKPFNPSIFVARVKALLRRSQIGSAPTKPEDEVLISGLRVNFKTYEISYNSEPLHLTPSEFKLLGALVQNQGVVLTREQLIENIQGEGINVVGRTIDTHVFGLRKKLGEWGDRIETIRGVGYRVKIDSL